MDQFILEYWMEFLFGVLGAIMIAWVKKLKKRVKQNHKEQDFIVQGLKALLKREIIRECDKYISLGYIPLEESQEILEELNELYEPYDGIGGNGPGEKKYKTTMNLPYKSMEEREEE